MKPSQFWRPSRGLSLALLTFAALALAASIVLFVTHEADVIIGAICNDGWLSDSAVQGRCSGHDGVATDRVIDTLAGKQVPGWMNWIRWPVLSSGVLAGIYGAIGLIASPEVGSRRRRPGIDLGERDLGFVDLIIEVAANDSGRQVTVRTPLGQRASVPFTFAGLSDRGADHLAKLLSKRHDRGLDSAQANAVKHLGTDLFAALFPAKLETLYRDALDDVRKNNMSLRISLQLDEATADLPWEYLYDSKRGTFLALSEETSVIRLLATPDATRPQSPIGRVRVLAMGATPSTLPILDIEADLAGIATDLEGSVQAGDTQLRIMADGTLADLRRALDEFEPHIFYFAGHGSWSNDADDGVIMVRTESGRPHSVTGKDLGVLLNRSGLRLVIFNSCEAARTSQHDRFAGVAASLVAQGVPAALGMQFRVEDRAAARFGRIFLAQLIARRSIDDGLTAARATVFASPNDVEWGTPVLTSRVPLDQVLPRAPACPAQLLKATSRDRPA